MTLNKKIRKYCNEFKLEDRGEDVVFLFNNESKELRNSVMQAHGDRLPNNYIFKWYFEILEALRDYEINNIEDIENVKEEIIDNLISIYTSDLTKWLADDNRNVYYIEEAQKECGIIEDGFKLLATAQYVAINEVFDEVINLLSS